MARADLHYALALDSEIHQASQVDASLLDPVVRVEGGLPGVARPIAVIRRYQGPQGSYAEYFVLRNRKGREVARSRVQRIRLLGEMFEDRFVDTLRGVELEDGDEHQLSFYVNDEEVGTIPVFVESGAGGDPRMAAEETLKKALQKGAVLWVGVPRERGRPHEQPVWFVTSGGKVYLVDGPGEQHVPGLAAARRVELVARSKDLRSRVSRVPAAVRVIPSADEEWTRIAEMALPKRLNLPDGDAAMDRWRNTCSLLELTPLFRDEEVDAAPAAVATSAAAEPSVAPAPAAPAEAAAPAEPQEEEVKVEAQVDQAVFDQLIAEGKPERVARARAKAAYVRAEKARLRGEGGTGSG